MQPSSIFFLTFLRQSHARGDPAFWRNRCAGPGSGAPILTLGTLLSSSALSHQRASLVGGEGLGTERLRIVAAVHDLVAINIVKAPPRHCGACHAQVQMNIALEPPTSRLLRSLDGGTDVDMHASLCLGRELLDQTGLKPGGSATLQSWHFAVSSQLLLSLCLPWQKYGGRLPCPGLFGAPSQPDESEHDSQTGLHTVRIKLKVSPRQNEKPGFGYCTFAPIGLIDVLLRRRKNTPLTFLGAMARR